MPRASDELCGGTVSASTPPVPARVVTRPEIARSLRRQTRGLARGLGRRRRERAAQRGCHARCSSRSRREARRRALRRRLQADDVTDDMGAQLGLRTKGDTGQSKPSPSGRHRTPPPTPPRPTRAGFLPMHTPAAVPASTNEGCCPSWQQRDAARESQSSVPAPSTLPAPPATPASVITRPDETVMCRMTLHAIVGLPGKRARMRV